MKKIYLSLGLIITSIFANAQNGLDSVIVEKYYVSTAADTVGQKGTGILPVGSVTYRVFVDMATGYNFQALYGTSNTNVVPFVPLHTLIISTSTSFFNNVDRGASSPEGIPSNHIKDNTVALDSWFSVGAAASGQVGVLKSEDNGSANLLFPHNPAGILTNTITSVFVPLSSQDGMVAGSPQSVTFVGLNSSTSSSDNVDSAFGSLSLQRNLFSTSNGSISSLSHSAGPLASNRVLVGQFTTDGVFHFELNLQLGTPGNGTERYVAYTNPADILNEISKSYLVYTSLTASITAPSTAKTSSLVAISAATSGNGIVDSISFFVDGVKIGNDVSAPYNYTWTPTAAGTHTLTIVANENDGTQTKASSTIIVSTTGVNTPPTVSITAPLSAATYTTSNVVAITATATDADGTVDSVVFFVDGIRVGKDVSFPYSYDWTSTVGTHTLTAVATDNSVAHTTSTAVVITVSNTVTGINDISATTSFLVYPNPASDVITLTINAAQQLSNAGYVVYDVIGNVILNKKLGVIFGNHQEVIEVFSFAKGMYIVKLSSDGFTSSKKIVID